MCGVDLGSSNGLATVAIVANVLSPVQARNFRTLSTTDVILSCGSSGLNGRRRMQKVISYWRDQLGTRIMHNIHKSVI
jgi:hypothetical protein